MHEDISATSTIKIIKTPSIEQMQGILQASRLIHSP